MCFADLTAVEATLEVQNIPKCYPAAYLPSVTKSNKYCTALLNTVITGVVTHTETQDMAGFSEYPQCPLLGTQKITFHSHHIHSPSFWMPFMSIKEGNFLICD